MPFAWTPLVDDSVPGAHDGTPTAAAPLNALAAKVGDDASAVTTSLDYLLKNSASVEPGHKHSKMWASDGSTQAVFIDANGFISFGRPINEGNYDNFEIYNTGGSTTCGIIAQVDPIIKYGGGFFNFLLNNPNYTVNNGDVDIFQVGAAGYLADSGVVTDMEFFIFDAYNHSFRLLIDQSGNIGINTPPWTPPTISDGIGLHLAGKIVRIAQSKTPATAGATGNKGEICWDSGFIYVAVNTNTWKRAPLSTW